MSALSRRNVLGVVAAVPAMALLPASLTVASPEVGATVFDLANRALQTWRELDAACSRLSRSEEIMIEWKARNPKPIMREVKSKNGTVEHSRWLKRWCEAAGPVEIEHLRQTDPDAELKVAVQEWETAVTAWGQRRRSAEKQSGYTQATEDEARTGDENQTALAALSDKQANTIEEIYAKARISRIMDDFDLRASIIWDLGVMAGDDLENEGKALVA